MEKPEPPDFWLMLREALVVRELPRLALRVPDLTRQPRGRGEMVLVLPGFGAGDASTIPLRSYLRWLGYEAHGWGLGANGGNVPTLVRHVIALVRRRAEESGARVRIIGWSLGGTLARETAREHPELVERVITMGTPVIGGPKYTAVADVYRQRGFDLDAIEAAVAERDRVPIRVPVTAIYTRSDGVVAWRACIDGSNPDVEHIEVDTTHIGLGINPEVYRIVAQRLARPRPDDTTYPAGTEAVVSLGAVSGGTLSTTEQAEERAARSADRPPPMSG
jgi:pimeloyl-ACP methyl ester carboxylesterase